MSLPLHLVPSLEGVEVGGRVEVTGDEAHHAVAVRRLRSAERVELTDGRGRVARGAVVSAGRRSLVVGVDAVRTVPRPQPSVTVVQALPKGERGELAVELLTEVGVDRIVPWAARRCVAVWRGDRADRGRARWAATAREAAKQARRCWFPEVAALASTAEVGALVGAADLAVVLHEGAAEGLAGLAAPEPGGLVVVVGPEGGVDGSELQLLRDTGALERRLGREVLRTSSAGIAAVAALLSRSTRWSG